MNLTLEQRQVLTDDGWHEHNPPKPGLWSKMFDDLVHYADFRGRATKSYYFEDDKSNRSNKADRIIMQVKAINENQKGLGEF